MENKRRNEIKVLHYEGHSFLLFVPFSRKDEVKPIGGIFVPKLKLWAIPEEKIKQLYENIDNVMITDNAKKEWENSSSAITIKEKNDISLPHVPYADKLYSFQRVGVAFLSTRGHKFLCDEMGLGKSVQSISTIINLGAESALFVVPNPLKYSWQSELAKWTGVLPNVLDGTRKKRIKTLKEESPFLIINYESLLSDDYMRILLQKHFDVIIADESTFLKNRKAQRTQRFKLLNADKKIFLTGTPVTNTPADLFAQLNIMYPYKYRSFWQFVRHYCFVDEISLYGRTIFKVYGVRNEDELLTELDEMLIRRTKKEVAQFLPDIITEDVILYRSDLPKEQRILYEQIEDELSNAAYNHDRNGTLKYFMYAQEVLETPQNLGIDAPSAKLQALKQIIETYDNENNVFVIWTQFVQSAKAAYKILENAFGKGRVGLVTGENRKEINSVIGKFRKGNLKSIVLTLKTGKFGLNLTIDNKTVIAIFLSKSFDFEEMKQAERRILRLTTTNFPVSLYIAVRDTIDDAVEKALQKKSDIFSILFS